MNARAGAGDESGMKTRANSRLPLGAVLLVAALASAGCSITATRRLASVPPGRLGYDDLCRVQDYFDAIEIKRGEPPAVVRHSEGDGANGRTRFQFAGEFQLAHLRRLLGEHWRNLPPELARAARVEIDVPWQEVRGGRRSAGDAELAIEGRGFGHRLPDHPCLSEWLFGEPLYRQRRVALGLPLIGATPPGSLSAY